MYLAKEVSKLTLNYVLKYLGQIHFLFFVDNSSSREAEQQAEMDDSQSVSSALTRKKELRIVIQKSNNYSICLNF